MLDKGLRVGLIGEAIDTVVEDKTALAVGSGAFKVYATPSLLALMEAASVSAIAPYLSDEHASVGIEAAIKHLSATPIGEGVVAMAEVTRIDGKRIHLEIRAWDERELIGIGTHQRYIVEIDEFESRLKRTDN